MTTTICITIILAVMLIAFYPAFSDGATWLNDKWHNRSIKPPLEFYKTSMRYCKKHDEWYDPVYGDGCWKCLVEAKNEE